MINRGNNRGQVFLRDDDYQEFVDLLEEGCQRHSVEVLAYCLMPNHFHLVVIPKRSDDLGRLMHRLQTTQARRRHRRHGTSGHVWQGRFKAFPVYKGEDGDSWKVKPRAAACRALGLLESVAATAGASQDSRAALEQRARLALQHARK